MMRPPLIPHAPTAATPILLTYGLFAQLAILALVRCSQGHDATVHEPAARPAAFWDLVVTAGEREVDWFCVVGWVGAELADVVDLGLGLPGCGGGRGG